MCDYLTNEDFLELAKERLQIRPNYKAMVSDRLFKNILLKEQREREYEMNKGYSTPDLEKLEQEKEYPRYVITGKAFELERYVWDEVNQARVKTLEPYIKKKWPVIIESTLDWVDDKVIAIVYRPGYYGTVWIPADCLIPV